MTEEERPPRPVVLQVWFDRAPAEAGRDALDLPKFKNAGGKSIIWAGNEAVEALFGERLWVAPDGGHVFRWACDYVVCSDERWTIFGPYANRAEAFDGWDRINAGAAKIGADVLGCRAIIEHCLKYVLKRGGKYDPEEKWPREVWTDG